MSTNVSTGWLKDNNGEKFAPKTLSTQVLMSDGNNLENKIKNLGGGSTEITIIEDGVESTLNGMRINKFDTKDECETALENGEIANNEFCSFPDEYDEELNEESTNAVQNKVVASAISEINSKLNISEHSFSFSNGVTDRGSVIRKIGNLCYLHIHVNIPNGFNSRLTLGSIPSDCKPLYTYRFVGVGSTMVDGALSAPCMGFINGTTIYVGDALVTTIKELALDIWYMTE